VRVSHRDDIQGLRAVAVLLVALAHAGVPHLAGGYVGVDVFFVVSGFLITSILASSVPERGWHALVDFYARRARRILPAAALTLAVTDIAAYVLLNFVQARATIADSLWASAFAANIRFAREGSDYFARAELPSPVQHFWTLGVEEQFYLVWPALFALVVLATVAVVRLRRPSGVTCSRAALPVVCVVAAASLAWSIHATSVEPDSAYFSTFARAWELALGAALALAAPSMSGRVPPRARFALGWFGGAGIIVSACLFSATTPFPGYAAVLPALGAALVLAAGLPGPQPRHGVAAALSLRPFRYVGDRSYSFYLWHWPVLALAAQYADREVTMPASLALLAGAFAVSAFTYRFFENPIRRSAAAGRIRVLATPASVACAVAVALFSLHLTNSTAARYDAAAMTVRPAALASVVAAPRLARASKPLPAVVAAVRAAERAAPLPKPLTPSVANLRGDFYTFPDGCTPAWTETTSRRICRMGAAASSKTLVVIGDSHAQMWMGTILRMADQDGWRVIPFVKLGCIPDFWTPAPAGASSQRTRCEAWLRWAKARAAAARPQATMIIGSWAGTRNPRPPIRGVTSLIASSARFSARVVVIGDAPHQGFNPTNCLLAGGATMGTCTTTARPADFRADKAIAAAARRMHMGFVDTRGWFCARATSGRHPYLCPLVVNRTITSIDRGHVGETYAGELLAPFRAAFLRALLG